jgi:hypothetical protein
MSLIAGVGVDLRHNLPSRSLNPFLWAYQLQNSLLWDFALETRLRARNLSEISLDPASLNSLQRTPEGYRLSIHGSQFKNRKSGFFKKDGVYITISWNLDPRLTRWIDLYLSEARPIFLDGRVGDFFFIQRNIRGVTRIFVKPSHLSLRAVEMSKAVAFNPITGSGIRGVEPFGLNAFRDICATHVLKQGGTWEQAAIMLTDTVTTVKKHYADFSPTDHLAQVQHFSRSVRPSDAPRPGVAMAFAA